MQLSARRDADGEWEVPGLDFFERASHAAHVLLDRGIAGPDAALQSSARAYAEALEVLAQVEGSGEQGSFVSDALSSGRSVLRMLRGELEPSRPFTPPGQPDPQPEGGGAEAKPDDIKALL